METGELHDLLLQMQTRLLRLCEQQARSRPGLDAEDLAQGAVVLFVERAPRWFAQAVQVSLEAQAWTLLKTCVRNLVTDHDREPKPTSLTGPDDEAEAGPGELPDRDGESGGPPPNAETTLLHHEDERRRGGALVEEIEAVGNPTYRLLLKCVYVPRLLDRDDFRAADAHRVSGAAAFARPWDEAAALILAHASSELASSGAPAHRDAWRRFLASCFRMTGDPWREPLSPQARGWVDRNLSRARAALDLSGKEEE